MSEPPERSRAWRQVGTCLGVLLLGLLLGAGLAGQLRPPPREPALLWDDYILAVAALYEREGDLEEAREWLAKLPTDDPTRSVVVLASAYTPDPSLGDQSGTALRGLATALTGRPFLAAAHTTSLDSAQSQSLSPLLASVLPIARSDGTWALLAMASAAWLGLVYARDRRSARASAAPEDRRGGAERAAIPERPKRRRPARRRTTEPAKAATEQRLPPRTVSLPPSTYELQDPDALAITFSYDGGVEPLEEMVPVADPGTGRTIAGCGMTNGPAARPAVGYLGFLIWLHELGSREMPQTVGLVAEGASEYDREAIAEWAAYVRLDEIVVARPGIIRTLETNRLRAAVTVTEMAYSVVGHRQYPVLGGLAVRLDISFRQESTVKRSAAGSGL